jgi:PAS domain S-box-containing protein
VRSGEDNAELYQRQVGKERDRLRLLLELNNHIVSKLDINELFGSASASIRTYFRNDFTGFWWIDKNSNQLECVVLDFPTGKGSLTAVLKSTRMGHFEHEEIQGRTPDAIFPPNDIPRIMRQHESGHKYGANRDEFYLPRKDGLKIPVIFSERIIQGPDGQEYSLINVTDISEQKRVEEQLRERQREIDADLSTAALIQQSLAPHNLGWEDLAVEADYSPARAQQGITYEYSVAALRRQPENGGKAPIFLLRIR